MASAVATPSPRLTAEEWAALPDDESSELVDGTLVDAEMPSFAHEVAVVFFVELLARWGRPRGARVGGSGVRLAVGAGRGRSPDACVYLAGSAMPAGRGVVRAPPTIAIEIVSASPVDARRDRVEKVQDYAALGVTWYWLVDPQVRTFEILERTADGRYAITVSASGGLVDPVPGCESLSIDLDALWADVDRALAEEGD